MSIALRDLNIVLRAVTLGFAVWLAAIALPARAALPAADEQQIQQVMLDDRLMERLGAVQREAQAQHIKARSSAATGTAQSLDSMAAELRDPRVKAMLARHGFAPRDYLAASIALVRAAMAARPEAAAYGAAIMKGTGQANVAYARGHATQIRGLLAAGKDDDEQED